jgi:hypothetical protein
MSSNAGASLSMIQMNTAVVVDPKLHRFKRAELSAVRESSIDLPSVQRLPSLQAASAPQLSGPVE